ncbi:hypothetical protein AVEN_155246-1 [Araneus ventricosus]|uniref:Uncharacterized protein n=1 Tax=Araneus ventricosus TaxID=182803 RepID=A0A4Y2D800_ARAVE|nr:hypothetical protein AVEN_155246-1 [Araneus ventricosus]
MTAPAIDSSTEAGVLVAKYLATTLPLPKEVRTITGGGIYTPQRKQIPALSDSPHSQVARRECFAMNFHPLGESYVGGGNNNYFTKLEWCFRSFPERHFSTCIAFAFTASTIYFILALTWQWRIKRRRTRRD